MGTSALCACLCLVLAGAFAWPAPAGAATRIFNDSFQDGVSDGWTTSQWQVCQPPGQDLAYCVTPSDNTYPVSRAGSLAWTNYTMQAAVEVTGIDGGIGLIARSADQNHFYMLQLKQFRKTYGWFIHRKDGDTWVDLASGSFPWVANQQYDLRFSLQGSALTAAISADGGATYTILGKVNDSTYTSGRIGVRAWDTTAYVDDVKVRTAP